MTELFERASRLKIIYNTPKGALWPHDLWELPLTSAVGKANLDDIARQLHYDLKDRETVSFVENPAPKDEAKQVAFDVVKRVIEVRKTERDAAKAEEVKTAMRQKVAAIIEEKQDGELRGKSLAELQEMLK